MSRVMAWWILGNFKMIYRILCFMMACSVGVAGAVNGAAEERASAESAIKLGRGNIIGIIVPKESYPAETRAAELLKNYLEKSLDAQVVVAIEGTQMGDWDQTVYLGHTDFARRVGLGDDQLHDEEYGIIAVEGKIVINGKKELNGGFNRSRDRYQGHPVVWAVNAFADRVIGVRWIWPGELGTYIPRHEVLQMPEGHWRYQPSLLVRRLRVHPRITSQGESGERFQDVVNWLEAFEVGQRETIPFHHAFIHWWKRFGETRPELFAIPPEGYKQPWPNAETVKLRLGNPAVIEQIKQEYIKAGAPMYWNVAPNDSIGFDTSEETKAWDDPKIDDDAVIWYGEKDGVQVNLTARYVRFWNALHAELAKVNPEVRLCAILYSRYRNPPPPQVKLTAKMVLATVDTPVAYDKWKAWTRFDVKMVLRHNWWHSGANAPELPLMMEGKFLEFALKDGLLAYDFDSLIGYWGTQAVRYYVSARLLVRPDYTTEQAIGDFLSAFGEAGELIWQYIQLWEEKSDRLAIPSDVGGPGSINRDGEFEVAARHVGHSGHPISGSYRLMGIVYDDEIIERGEHLLEEAKKVAEEAKQPDVVKRVEFMQLGLEEFKRTREVVAMGYRLRELYDESMLREFEIKSKALEEFRNELNQLGVIWKENLDGREKWQSVPVNLEQLRGKEPDMRGM